jgi:hypothetical protein
VSDGLLAAYTFLPWVRRGLARSIDVPDEQGAGLRARVTLPVRVRVDGAGEVSADVRLHGPGDVAGLQPSAILRTDPPPGTTGFEAGYMPSVQFAHADLPWLFTPTAPGANGRLRPWLCLVAVRRRQGVRLDPSPGGPLPVLELASPEDELPDLSCSWAWAHAQIGGLAAGRTPAEILREPGRGSSRVVCPRRLEPETAYLACLVPTFLAGVQAGLGADPDESRLDPAWGGGETPDPLRLPVYHVWEFATGPAGSFETLVRRLRPHPPSAEAARPATLDLGDAGGGLPPGAVVELESALRIPGPDGPAPWPDEARVPFQQALEERLEARADTVAAPVYGAVQAGRESLPAEGDRAAWLRELNLDPRLRVAAAAGARVVQERQEELLEDAWAQAGGVREVNATLARSQVVRELGGVLLERRLKLLPAETLLAVTQPAHTRVSVSGEPLDAELRASRLPEAAVSAAMRRLASPQGPLARRAASGPVGLLAALDRRAAAPPPAAPAGMVALVADGSREPAAPPPETRPALSAQSVQARLLDRLRPDATVLERVKARVDAPPGTWDRPDALAPVAAGPEFPQPMYEGLRDVAPHLLLPGLGHVEPDSVALLEPSSRLIEAYMVGLNHELSRELLWREFPAKLGGTPFRQFWDVRAQGGDADALRDIPPIEEWDADVLGAHLRGAHDGQVVLLVRGELLRRYPATTIYAAAATADGGLDPRVRVAPSFRGVVPPDVTFVGFPLTEEAVRDGWHVVFEEHPGEPRFGFDEQGPATPTTPDELAWTHVPLTVSGHVDVSRPLEAAGDDLQAAWGRDAAGMARLALQKPFRVAIHASTLLPPEVES